MAIFDLFSKRQRQLHGKKPDILQYNILTSQLRVQIAHIIRDAIGSDRESDYHSSYSERSFQTIQKALCREYGLFQLGDGYNERYGTQVLNFLLTTEKTEEALDVIELSFKYINREIRNAGRDYTYNAKATLLPDNAVAELNERFREKGVG